MTALNFPDSSASPWTAPNGITYQWVVSGSSGYWEALPSTNTQYLSAVDNDVAQGEITFEQVTTHEAGVSVTGGDTNGGKERGVTAKCTSATDRIGAQVTSSDDTFTSFTGFNSYCPGSVTNITHFDCSQSLTKTYGTVKGFAANNNLLNGTTASYGFWSDIATDVGPANYNFYAAGSAPNYFAGKIESPAGPSFVSPSDMWTPVVYGNGIGFFYTSGGFKFSLNANGYRNSSGTWTSLGTNGSTAATSIELYTNTGRIERCVENNKPTGTGSGIAPRFTVTEAGGTSANFFINVEADNPNAYQTTYSVDGAQQQDYIGEQIDLKAVILELKQAKTNLEARVAALETPTPDPTTTPTNMSNLIPDNWSQDMRLAAMAELLQEFQANRNQ